MYLTEEQQAWYDGKNGFPLQKAMEIIVQLGKIYGAERLIPISSVHMPGSSVVVSGEAGVKFVEKMAETGVFRVPTTLNTGALDMESWESLGYKRATYDLQCRLTGAYQKMGATALHSCTPYLGGSLPRKGQHIAWGESSAIAFINSVVGARTNREGGPSALASAITGLAADYGYHLDENRAGQFLIHVDTPLKTSTDFGSLGYWTGKIVESGVPVFTGISEASVDQLKMLSAALASSGSVALFHIVGLTPEAPTLDAAFLGGKAQSEMVFDQKALNETREKLNKHHGEDISLVAIGCPHASMEELEEIAGFMKGKKVKSGIHFWIMVSVAIKAIAQRSGYLDIIKEAGGKIVLDTCPILSPMQDLIKANGLKSMVTNSAKLAHYGPGQIAIPTYYGDLEKCLNAAVSGKI
ncbi:aconitase X catalytic domain-containing protein [Treponema primitia]|uniref:aconitase X n=1 Tax=Treponema primitia TaxID=88058 RepID=UPI00397E9670